MNKDNDPNDIVDKIDKVVSLYEENKGMLEGLFDTNNGITIDDQEPLKQALVDDDKVIITVEVGRDDIANIGLELQGSNAKITVGDSVLEAEVPEDVQMDSASADLNNGVLEVTIPREGGEN